MWRVAIQNSRVERCEKLGNFQSSIICPPTMRKWTHNRRTTSETVLIHRQILSFCDARRPAEYSSDALIKHTREVSETGPHSGCSAQVVFLARAGVAHAPLRDPAKKRRLA